MKTRTYFALRIDVVGRSGRLHRRAVAVGSANGGATFARTPGSVIVWERTSASWLVTRFEGESHARDKAVRCSPASRTADCVFGGTRSRRPIRTARRGRSARSDGRTGTGRTARIGWTARRSRRTGAVRTPRGQRRAWRSRARRTRRTERGGRASRPARPEGRSRSGRPPRPEG
jgi:hypothetical protein